MKYSRHVHAYIWPGGGGGGGALCPPQMFKSMNSGKIQQNLGPYDA